MIKQHILKESFQEISHDTKFIRLATITTFIHSVLFLLYLAYIASNLLSKGGENQVLNFLLEALGVTSNIPMILIIIVGIILLIGYAILPPIGEGAMIFYLNNPKKQGTLSIGKGMSRFLQMFEFDAAINFFTIPVLLIAISRLYIMGALGNVLVISLIIMWCIIIFFAAFLLPYTRYLIVLKNEKFFDAMRKSMTMAVEHFALTFRFIIVDAILHIRFVINIIIILGIPLGLMYIANRIGIADNNIIQTIFVILTISLFLITAYINGIIEAFFTTYRYKLYKHVLKEESHTQAAIDQSENPLPTDLAIQEEEKEQQKQPQQVIINQYVVGGTQAHPGQSPQQPQYPNQQYVVPEHEYTVPPTPTDGQTPQPIPTAQVLENIPGAQQIPTPDGGHFVYVPPTTQQITNPKQVRAPEPVPTPESEPAPTPIPTPPPTPTIDTKHEESKPQTQIPPSTPYISPAQQQRRENTQIPSKKPNNEEREDE